MKMKIIKTCLVALIFVNCYAEALQELRKANVLDGNQADNNKTTQQNLYGAKTSLVRYKRGWGSILFTGVAILTRATSFGMTLAGALTGGCAFKPDICVYKRKLEKYESQITHLEQQYETVYFSTKRAYLDLRTAMINNGYIEYFINHTMQMVENLQDIEEDISSELELKLPKMYRIFEMSKNYSFQQYLGTVVGQLEYRLSDIKKMILENKRNALIGIVVQFVIEATLRKFMTAFQNAYKVVDNEDIIATTNKAFWWERMEDQDANVSAGRGKFRKLKLVPKTLKLMTKNAGKRFRKFGESIKKWGRIKSWKGFKGKFTHTFSKPLQKLKNVKDFLNPKKNPQFVDRYKIKWSQGIMTGLGIAADVITQIIIERQWDAIEKQMKDLFDKHKKYKTKLEIQLKKITDEMKKMDDTWTDLIEIFRNMSLTFKSLITNATRYSNFSNVVGLPKLPVDTSTPLFTIDFDKTDKTSIKSNQEAVINFLKSVDNNMSVIEDQMRARLVLYNNTLNKTDVKESMVDLLSDVKSILNFSPSMTMKSYGKKLKMKDIVCTVSILRPDIDEYDFYSLEPFRPRCEVSSFIFENLTKEASSKRKTELMRIVVKRVIKSQPGVSLSTLLQHVHTAYSVLKDTNIAQYGASITDQDIMCVISEEFPSRPSFDFINLDPFRPDCSAVSTENFNELKRKAENLKSITKGLETDLKVCNKFRFCPCLSMLSDYYKVTVQDIKTFIPKIEPTWKPKMGAMHCRVPPCPECETI